MNEANETTILEEGNVRITNRRAIVRSKTYAMSNITSVSMVKNEPSNSGPILMGAGITLVILDLTIFGLGGFLVMGIILVIVGLNQYTKSKTTYAARIGSVSGEVNLLESQDQSEIRRIVDAVNNAIIRGG